MTFLDGWLVLITIAAAFNVRAHVLAQRHNRAQEAILQNMVNLLTDLSERDDTLRRKLFESAVIK